MTHRKGTFKPASARSKKAALAASEEEAGQSVQDGHEEQSEDSSYCIYGINVIMCRMPDYA